MSTGWRGSEAERLLRAARGAAPVDPGRVARLVAHAPRARAYSGGGAWVGLIAGLAVIAALRGAPAGPAGPVARPEVIEPAAAVPPPVVASKAPGASRTVSTVRTREAERVSRDVQVDEAPSDPAEGPREELTSSESLAQASPPSPPSGTLPPFRALPLRALTEELPVEPEGPALRRYLELRGAALSPELRLVRARLALEAGDCPAAERDLLALPLAGVDVRARLEAEAALAACARVATR